MGKFRRDSGSASVIRGRFRPGHVLVSVLARRQKTPYSFGSYETAKPRAGRCSQESLGRIQVMKKNIARARVAQIVALGIIVGSITPVAAQNRAEGKLDVEGKPVAITQVY